RLPRQDTMQSRDGMKMRNSVVRRQTSKRVWFTLLGVVTSGALGAATAAAQSGLDNPTIDEQRSGQFNLQRFRPAPGPRNFLVTRTVRTDGEHAFNLGALGSVAYEPLVVELAGDVCQERQDCRTRAVQGLATLDVMGTYTPIPDIQLGLRIPLTYAYGQGMTAEG